MTTHDKRPKPLVPAHVSLRGSEPPWDVFVEMQMSEFGVSREVAEADVEAAKARYRARKGH